MYTRRTSSRAQYRITTVMRPYGSAVRPRIQSKHALPLSPRLVCDGVTLVPAALTRHCSSSHTSTRGPQPEPPRPPPPHPRPPYAQANSPPLPSLHPPLPPGPPPPPPPPPPAAAAAAADSSAAKSQLPRLVPSRSAAASMPSRSPGPAAPPPMQPPNWRRYRRCSAGSGRPCAAPSSSSVFGTSSTPSCVAWR